MTLQGKSGAVVYIIYINVQDNYGYVNTCAEQVV